jgi:hypothetical protein
VYIHFSNSSIPLGKRKQAYVKWLMKKHRLPLEKAKLACSRKFDSHKTWAAEDSRIKREQGWE